MIVRKIKTIVFLVFAVFIWQSCAAANNLQKKSNELKYISHKIQTLKKQVHSNQTKKKKILGSLQKNKRYLGKLSNDIHYTSYVLNKQQTKLKSTTERQRQLINHLDKQKELLSKQTKLIYILGRKPYLKILLNQEHPEQVSRFLQYYLYLQTAHANNIKQIKVTTDELERIKNHLKHRSHDLTIMQHKQKERFSKKQHETIKHEHLLEITNQNLEYNQRRLKQLYTDKKRLESIIKKLANKKQYGYIPGTSFNQMRGKLYWPVPQQKLLQRFGQTLEHGYLHSNGILISATDDTKVHAIFPGKIVYADWLRGFGLLIIEQHGRDYITLYGHNKSLYVKTGQDVKAGQIIALAGKNKDFHDSALYFEIRHQSTPVNPLRWLKKS